MKKLVFLFTVALFSNLTWAQINPAIGSTPTPAEEKSNAAIKFETTSHSFGTVIEGQIATYDFKFTNTGTDPLVLGNVSASCGCTTPKWPREAIAPGQSAVVSAEYNSNGRPGTFNKNIFQIVKIICSKPFVLFIFGIKPKIMCIKKATK